MLGMYSSVLDVQEVDCGTYTPYRELQQPLVQRTATYSCKEAVICLYCH